MLSSNLNIATNRTIAFEVLRMNHKHPAQVVPAPFTESTSNGHSQLHNMDTNRKTESRAASWRKRSAQIGQSLAAGYNNLQVSHRGMYSIERLKAFQTYCQKTSAIRAIAVCVLTPAPSLLAVILLECIPLRRPEEGWKVNIGFWIRFSLSRIIIAVCCTYQVKDMVERLRISITQCLGIAVVVMSVYIATLIAIATAWGFPVPFGIVFGVGPTLAVYAITFVLIIGRNVFKANTGLVQEVKLQFYVLGVQGIVAFVYPAFTSVYNKASSNQRAALVLLLPIIKVATKNIVAWACSHLEDYVPVITVFSIEVFNALYVATCMQSTKSTLATSVIIAFDVVNGVLTFRSLIKRTQAIHKQMRLLMTTSADKIHSLEELLPKVMEASHNLRTFRTRQGTAIRVSAPLKLRFGVENYRVLDSIARHLFSFEKREALQATTQLNATNSLPYQKDTKNALTCPVTSASQDTTNKPSKQNLHQVDQKLELVESTLQLLFHCEYHALVEYVECAVPMVFGIYSSILCELPSREYYPLTKNMAPGQLKGMLASLSVYVALEILSFIAMHTALMWKFKLSALYQLAFVLETQTVQIQTRLFFWIVFILQFTLEHYGVDFTFRFAWMHSSYYVALTSVLVHQANMNGKYVGKVAAGLELDEREHAHLDQHNQKKELVPEQYTHAYPALLITTSGHWLQQTTG
ncbi:unnamed protein product [Phytophthora fragariaefolia]|uniref:Unnamed protein product n=1 Tax=Phytophthora fragariaefolia TaxID=1490495 RepID=A0A9W6Y1V8_9STRA|nr:unnamed protein product [Phytophthora fragariaefolia]